MQRMFILLSASLIIFCGRGDSKAAESMTPPETWKAMQLQAASNMVARLQGVTNIVFIEAAGGDTNKWRSFGISGQVRLRPLLSSIELHWKARCQCEHSLEAIFEGSAGVLRVSFCPHCFDSRDEWRAAYMMPPGFYEEFEKLAKDHHWKPVVEFP